LPTPSSFLPSFSGPHAGLFKQGHRPKKVEATITTKIFLKMSYLYVVLGRISWGDVEWIWLAQDRIRWRALVNAVMNLRVLEPRSCVCVCCRVPAILSPICSGLDDIYPLYRPICSDAHINVQKSD
jgi:hypothetical protein